jgi:1,4-dihydroxy-2-naphthoate octaprenyltransferase
VASGDSPEDLPAAATSAVVGAGVAFRDSAFLGGPALACLLAVLLLQIGANPANDVFDKRFPLSAVRRSDSTGGGK